MCRNNGMPHDYMVMSAHNVDSHDIAELNDRSMTSSQFQLHTKSMSPMLVQIKWSITDMNKFSIQVMLMDHARIFLLKRYQSSIIS